MNARIILVLLASAACLCHGLHLRAQQIVQAEYFFDTDLGVGQNSPLSIVSSDTVLFSSAVPMTGLTPGYHYLYVRTKDQNEQWSTTLVKRVYIFDVTLPPSSGGTQVVHAEYYAYQNPGPGNGYPISFAPGDTVVVTDTININTLNAGVVPINLRVQDSNGIWSYVLTDTVFRDAALTLQDHSRPIIRPGSMEAYELSITNRGYKTAFDNIVVLYLPFADSVKITAPSGSFMGNTTDSFPAKIQYRGHDLMLFWFDSIRGGEERLIRFLNEAPNGAAHSLYTTLTRFAPRLAEEEPASGRFIESDLYYLIVRSHRVLADSIPGIYSIQSDEFDSLALDFYTAHGDLFSGRSLWESVGYLYNALYGFNPTDSALLVVFEEILKLADLNESLFQDDDGELRSESPVLPFCYPPPWGWPYDPERCGNCPPASCYVERPTIDPPSLFHITNEYCTVRCNHRQTHTHDALDIWTSELSEEDYDGTMPVKAAIDGEIHYTGVVAKGDCGLGATITNGCGLEVHYCHLQSPVFSNDDDVLAGEIIAYAATRQNTSKTKHTPHIHIETRLNGDLEDPTCFIPAYQSNVAPKTGKNCDGGQHGIGTQCMGPQDLVYPNDPNEKYGPWGYAIGRQIAADVDIPYEIMFENVDSAVASAQSIWVCDTLDLSAIDPLSFIHRGIASGSAFFNVPESFVLSFEDTVDLRDSRQVLAAVSFALDTLTGLATWHFTSLDTLTLQPTMNPLLGFLPPNISPPEGTGLISYTARFRADVPHGTVLSNKAVIVFDSNDPIVTTAWVNTVDRQAPFSEVLDLQEFTTDTLFEVHWSGADNGQSGVEYFDTYFAVNQDTLFEPWLQVSSDTTAIFEGEIGNTYYFYSVAVDSVGNREEEGLHFDAFTTVTISTPIGSYQDPGMNLSIFPNPTTGSVTLRGRTESGCRLGLVVRNAVGQELLTKTIGVGPGPIMEQVDLSRLAVGTYFVTVNCNDSKLLERLIRISE